MGFKHLDRYKEQISGEVQLSPGPSKKDACRKKLSSNQPLVALHVRRGEYTDGQLFSLQSVNYYLERIAKVMRSIPNPRRLRTNVPVRGTRDVKLWLFSDGSLGLRGPSGTYRHTASVVQQLNHELQPVVPAS